MSAEINEQVLAQPQPGQEQAPEWVFPPDAPAAEQPARVGMPIESSETPGVFGVVENGKGWDFRTAEEKAATSQTEAQAPQVATEAPVARPDSLNAMLDSFDEGKNANFPITIEASQAKRGRVRKFGHKILQRIVSSPSEKSK
jgi:hypothetical protein